MTASATSLEDSRGASWRESLSREEIRELLRMNDLRSWLSVGANWGLVAAALAMVAAWPNPLTVVLALFVVGARQLGCAVLMHEAAHRSLFRSRRVNDFVGNWLCAYPIWSNMDVYRPYHLKHHAKTGTPEDPDLGLITPFPITRGSLKRKVWRDLSGQTGIKFAKGSFKRSVAGWKAGNPAARRATVGVVVTNALLLAACTAAGYPALYLVWAGAWLTTNTLVTRIRSIAEHAMTPDQTDPLRNTRTTLARWWERLLVAPNRVNYHLEHHLLMTVPHYNLPRMHALLRERGLLDEACVTRGYPEVLRNAASKSEAPEPASG